jgi:hypothetical protein|tara:strand:+ start:148 stop:321 length:174 start_codon:yes stop_codon:yes gene_type:complete
MTVYSPETIQEMYLDYVNNYLTVEVFAEHYNIRVQTAHFIINAGRKDNVLSRREIVC